MAKLHFHGKVKDASEEISLSKILAQFPSLRAYGLSKVGYMDGEVYVISTYNIPRDVFQSVSNYVRTIKTVKDKCGCK